MNELIRNICFLLFQEAEAKSLGASLARITSHHRDLIPVSAPFLCDIRLLFLDTRKSPENTFFFNKTKEREYECFFFEPSRIQRVGIIVKAMKIFPKVHRTEKRRRGKLELLFFIHPQAKPLAFGLLTCNFFALFYAFFHNFWKFSTIASKGFFEFPQSSKIEIEKLAASNASHKNYESIFSLSSLQGDCAFSSRHSKRHVCFVYKSLTSCFLIWS